MKRDKKYRSHAKNGADLPTRRRITVVAKPDPNFDAENATPEQLRREFSNRLQFRMSELGWNQSEMARQVALHLPEGEFGRDNISGYIRHHRMPRPEHARAIAAALRCDVSDLIPQPAPKREWVVETKALSPTEVLVRINVVVSPAKARKIYDAAIGTDDEGGVRGKDSR